MEQNLGRGNGESFSAIDADAVHPNQALVDAIVDSHERRSYYCEDDNKLLEKAGNSAAEVSKCITEARNETINGYTLTDQINLRKMLGKDAWRS